mgnify:CR=1 FL=1
MSKNIKSDSKILKGIKNPTNSKYEIIITTQEFTFFGVKNQPDYGNIEIVYYPNKSVIELKSLKLYLQQYRNEIISYERVINKVYEDLMKIYKPKKLIITIEFNSRGGIVSTLTIDSTLRKK